ncbi:MAG: protein kinase domain-containing protein [Pirellulaceae bacterium]
MPAELKAHPSSAELHSFAHGRLPVKEMEVVERHIAHCDSCCKVLENVPEDTLVQMAREAATEAFRAGAAVTSPGASPNQTIPPELTEHQRYKILGLVGLGGMGAVYKAEHRMMERLVALKVISRSFTANPQAVERFRREVKAAAKLSHANIVTAHDAEQAGELHFLVMEFVDGVGLDRLIAKQGTPTIPQACGLIRQAALGLQHAHEKGMVHRDIKPANLMVTRKGQVKILDFGLARLAREMVATETQAMHPGHDAPADATTAGMILGTPDYIAPEQATDSRSADIRADIYSLGCTFYFLLTGQPPFPKGTVMQKLAAHLHEAPAALALKRSDIPAEVSKIVLRMMAKKPEERYQTPADVAKDLKDFLDVQKGAGTSQPKLEELKPADDFFAGVDLAALPTGPAFSPASAAAPYSPSRDSAAGGDISDWLVENKRPAAIAGAIAGCLILAALCVWGAGKYFGGDKPAKTVQTVQKNDAVKSAPVETPVERPVVPTKSPAISASLPSQPQSNQPRILFCVPHTGLYEPDFYNVMATLEGKASVTVASTVRGPCKIWDASRPNRVPQEFSQVTAQVVIDTDNISAKNFDAIIFAGANTQEFHTPETRQLVSEFRADSKKLITGICYGQEVLAHCGLLGPGVSVADSSYMSQIYPKTKCTPVPTEAIQHENLITGRDANAGDEFAALLLSAIRKNNP